MPEMRSNTEEIMNKIDDYKGRETARVFHNLHKGVNLYSELFDATYPENRPKLIIKYFLSNKKLTQKFIKTLKDNGIDKDWNIDEKWLREKIRTKENISKEPIFSAGAQLRVKPLKDGNYLIIVGFRHIIGRYQYTNLDFDFSYITDYKGLMDFFKHVFIDKSWIEKALKKIEKYRNTELKKETKTQPWGLKLPELVNKRAKRPAQRKVEYLLRKERIASDFKRKLQRAGISPKELEGVTVYVRYIAEPKEPKYEYIITLDFTYHYNSSIKHFIYSFLATREELLYFVKYS